MPQEDLARFLDLLRRRGFPVGADDYVAVEALGLDLADAETHKVTLRALLAFGRDSWDEFNEIYDQYFEVGRSASADAFEEKPARASRKWARSTWLALLGFVAVLLIVPLTIVLDTDPPPPAQIDEPLGDDPVPDATEQELELEEDLSPLVDHGGHEEEEESRSSPALFFLLGGGASLAALFFVLARVFRERPVGPFIFDPAYPESARFELPPALHLGAHISLSWRTRGEVSKQVDVRRSILATIAQGGRPKTILRHYRRHLRYAILLDEHPASRAYTTAFHDVFERLHRAGVDSEIFRYRGTPEQVHSEGLMSYRRLPDLADRGFDALIVIGDPSVAEMQDFTPPWLDSLRGFRHVWWMVPNHFTGPVGALDNLEQAGVTVLPAELDALVRLGPRFGAEAARGNRRPPGERAGIVSYAGYLGEQGLQLLGAALSLPTLSHAGVAWLIDRHFRSLPADVRLRVMALPWLADGEWPTRLRADLEQWVASRADEPRLRAVRASVQALLSTSEPSRRGSRAHLQWRLHLLEQHIALGRSGPELTRQVIDLRFGSIRGNSLARASAFVRSFAGEGWAWRWAQLKFVGVWARAMAVRHFSILFSTTLALSLSALAVGFVIQNLVEDQAQSGSPLPPSPERVPTAAKGAAVGQRKGPCRDDSTCEGDLKCVNEVCHEVGAPGQFKGPCLENEICEHELECVQSVCRAVGGQGQRCRDGVSCDDDLTCKSGYCIPSDLPLPDFSPSATIDLSTFVVRMSSHKELETARELLEIVEDEGFTAVVVRKWPYYCVIIEAGSSEQEAEEVRARAQHLVPDAPFIHNLAAWCDSPRVEGDHYVCRNYVLWARTHADLDSARTNAERLEMQDYPTRIVKYGEQFRVLTGLYETTSSALSDEARVLEIVGGESTAVWRPSMWCKNRQPADGYDVCAED